MKDKNLHIRMSLKRHDKLKSYAQSKEKTITQLVEDWVDRLPNTEIRDSSSTSIPYQPNG